MAVKAQSTKNCALDTFQYQEENNDEVIEKDELKRMNSEVTIAQPPISIASKITCSNSTETKSESSISSCALDLTSPTSRSFSTDTTSKEKSPTQMPAIISQRIPKEDVLISPENITSSESNVVKIKEEIGKKSTPTSQKYFPNVSKLI